MPKQLNVNLAFTADTAQVKQQIQDLQNALSKLSTDTIKNNAGLKITEDLQKSVTAASELKDMVQQAVNPKTGNLDLSKFSEQLKSSGRELQDYARDLNNLGPEGTKAFMQLAQSVAAAEVPIKRTNALLDNLKTTVMNAARWQISSSLIHGFMGAIQGAYGYAQDLNESLNNIRIVTGLSTDQMAEFADEANRSAQALSASTLAYTDAALIYYQQGIRDQDEIQSRVDTTIKLSNVTGQSAEQVSSYMTAIWNNFYDGSQSLESYADKITALGAATASSSEEIARGLQQFASLGSSLGLNYDDAVAALATVVAQTRQSASTVGNSFRTLLQRFESLKLGETLEDGVDLTKYSEALNKVGVQVLDVNGEMRDMSDVIQDLGAKWQTLSQAQKNALAQTVGGVRNANTMIAWMENFDKFQENLTIAQGAEGELQKQQDIYAQGWEAAQKRVKAAWQAIYQDLIDDKFFISMLNGLEKVLHGVDALIDGMGGLKGVLGVVGSIITSVFAKDLAKGIDNAIYNFKVFTGEAEMAANQTAIQFSQMARDLAGGLESPEYAAKAEVMQNQIDYAIQLRAASDKITEADLQRLQTLASITEEYGKAYIEAEKLRQEAENTVSKTTSETREKIKYGASSAEESKMGVEAFDEAVSTIKQKTEDFGSYNQVIQDFKQELSSVSSVMNLSEDAVNQWGASLKNAFGEGKNEVLDSLGPIKDSIYENIAILNDENSSFQQKQDALYKVSQALQNTGNAENNFKEYIAEVIVGVAENNDVLEGNADKLEQIAQEHFKYVDAVNNSKNAGDAYTMSLEKQQEALNMVQSTMSNFSTTIVSVARGVSQLWTAFSSFSKILDTLNDKDLSWGEKLKAIIPSLAMAIPMLISGLKSMSMATGAFGQVFSNAMKIFIANMTTGATVSTALSTTLGYLTTSIGGLISSMLPFIGIAAAVGVAVFGLVKAFQAWKATTPEGQLEAANKQLEEASEEADKAAQAYKDLASATNEYRDVRESIAEMDDGVERNRAISEENEKILDLLKNVDNWKEKIGELEYDDSGLIKLEEWQLKILENDAAREASLKRQAELEAEINKEKAEQAKENADYSGKEINVTKKTGTTTVSGGGEDHVVDTYEKRNITGDVASALAAAGISNLSGLKADAGEKKNADTEEQIRSALEAVGLGEDADTILNQLNEIANSETESANFEQLIASNTDSLNNIDLAQKGLDAEQFNQGVADLGQENLDAASPFADVQKGIVEDFIGLTDEQQETIRNAIIVEGKTLEEAWSEAGLNLEQLIEEQTTQMRMNLLDNVMKAGDLQGNAEGQQEAVDWFNNLDEDELKILATLDIDEDTSFQEIQDTVEALSHEITFEVDADVDEEELERLSDYISDNAEEIDGLSDHLKTCRSEAKKVAHAILRFDDAIQDVTEHYDDWSDALKKGTMQDAANAAAEMTDAYGDLLDIDGSQLSADFLQNAENLELMKQATEGSEEAYKQLQAAANEDIITHLEFAPEDLTEFYNQLDNVQQLLADQNFPDLEVGANLDTGNFLQSLTDMVNAAHMTEEEATAYLANMGIDAEVKTVPAETTTVNTGRQYWEPAEYAAGTPISTGGEEEPSSYTPLRMTKPGRWVPVDESHEEQASPSAFSLEVTSAHKSSGGGFKFSNSNHGGGSGGGGGGGGRGSCFAAGTLITTQNNYKNIEDIETGDIVLSYNEKTNKNEYSEVVQTMIHFVYEKIYNLFVKNEKITATGIHRFLITRKNKRKWIPASDLKVGDLVLLANGELQEISKIDTEVKPLTVYNFEVSNTHNYYVGENQILAHNKGGGGGGKAKKKKTEKPKEKKENIKEKDRYHNIKEQIEDLNTEMERLEKNKDRAYGKDRIKYMDQEIDRTKKQIDLTKKYIKEIKDYAKQDKAALEKTLKEIGMSDKQIAAQFDENGVLKDYEALLEAIQDKFDKTATKAYNKAIDDYNKAVEVFNASDQGDAATEAFDKAKEALEKAEETYDKQKENYDKQLDSLSQYEDTMNLLQEKQQELIDQMNDLFDKALELASYKIEIQLDVNDRDLEHLQWLYDNIGESADRVADRIANLNKQAEVSVKNIKANADGIRNIFSDLQKTYTDEKGNKIIDFSGINLDIDPTDSASLINTVSQVVEKMKSVGAEADIQTFLDKITEYEDNLMDEYRNLSDINEQITDNMREAFEEWRDQLEKNLDDNDHMQELLQSYQDIADLLGQEHMGISDEEMQQWRKSMLELQRDAAQVAQANWNYAKDARAKAQKEYEDAIASGNQLAIDQAKAMLEEAEEFEKEAHKEYLERVKETLRTAEEIYQQSLENNEKAYQRALGGGIAPTLDKLQEQLDIQKELDHLHLDDYEKYKKLGDLQANINKQLANNPNVKVQGKLKGLLDDVNEKMAAGAEISEGEATILEKRLQLLQAEDQLMAARNAKSAVRMTRDNEGNFSYTYTADTSKIEEAQQNYADKFYDLLDYERKYSEDTQAAILQSYKEFLDKRNDIISDESLTDSEKAALLKQLERDMQAKVQFYTDEMKMVTDEMGRLKDEDWADMQQTLGRLLAEDDDFETSFEDTTLAKIAPAWNSAADAMKAFTTAASQLKADDLQAIAEWVNINEASMQNVGTSTLQFGKELTEVYAQLEEKSNDAKEAAKKMAEETTPKYDEMIAKGKEFSDKYGEYFSNVVTNIDKVVDAIEKLRKSLAGINEVGDISAIFDDALGGTPEGGTSGEHFDTGGYTGAWGKSGKLAVLHQKELVLNEDDTKNMLRAIDILRNIPALSSNINVNNNIDYSGLAAVGAGDLQQQVHIDASFPNVQSHNEIELALNNLINSASQYVNRKKS